MGSDGESMSPSPGAILVSTIIIMYILCLQTSPVTGIKAVLQRTVVEEPISLNRVNSLETSTQSPFVSLLVCGSPQCQLCLGSCNQCSQCQACQRFCGEKTRVKIC